MLFWPCGRITDARAPFPRFLSTPSESLAGSPMRVCEISAMPPARRAAVESLEGYLHETPRLVIWILHITPVTGPIFWASDNATPGEQPLVCGFTIWRTTGGRLYSGPGLTAQYCFNPRGYEGGAASARSTRRMGPQFLELPLDFQRGSAKIIIFLDLAGSQKRRDIRSRFPSRMSAGLSMFGNPAWSSATFLQFPPVISRTPH